jgi:hypothetical protein
LSIAALVFVSTVFAQTEEPLLHSDSTVPVKLAGGAERLWRISLPEGQTANLEIVEQQSSPSDGSAAQAKKEVDGLVEKFETVEAEIRRTSPRYAALLETHTLSLADVQSELKDSQTALAEFWLGEGRSYGWLITKTACRGFELPARRENRSARTPRLFGFDRPQSHSRRDCGTDANQGERVRSRVRAGISPAEPHAAGQNDGAVRRAPPLGGERWGT